MTSAPSHSVDGKMQPASIKRPCPVCGKHDWCLVAPDGTAALCQRVKSGTRRGDAGWLHRFVDTATRSQPPRPSKDWTAEARRYAANLDPERRQAAASWLGLPTDALDPIPLIGEGTGSRAGWFLTFPEVNATGAVIGLVRRFENHTKRTIAGGKRGLSLPDGWRDRPGTVFVVEGPTDALAMAAAGLACVGRPSNSGGSRMLADLFRDWPSDRSILVVGENDRKPDGKWPGRDGASAVAATMATRLRRPIGWTLPPDPIKDVRDWLSHGDRGDCTWLDRGTELAALLHATASPVGPGVPAGPDDGKSGRVPAQIVIGTDQYRVNAEATAALATEPDLFQRSAALVYVAGVDAEPPLAAAVRRPPGSPVIREVVPALLQERLTRCARWVEERGNDIRAAHPPGWCVAAVHARGTWPGVRRLEAVVAHPVLLADGSVLAVDGYDPGSGLLACLPPDLTIAVPDRPTRAAAAAAVAALGEVVVDFPFETPGHRAAWVAGLLTPLAWFAFDGPAPLFLIDANVRAAGKGLLADVIALVLTGRRFPVMSYTNDRDELRKRITTLAVEGERLVLLDNLAGPVGNDVLDSALTSDRWKDRLLGGNRGYDGPLHVCWYATGNNVQLHADTSRRVCHARMETAEERPELRAGFRHPDLRAHVRRDRGRLLSAALTVLRAWVTAGRPRHGLPSWGSFEGWSGVVREAVVFAGLPDPGETRLALQTAADRDAGAMAIVLRCLEALDPDRRGLTTAGLTDFMRQPHPTDPVVQSELRSAVEDLCGRPDAKSLGYKFRHFARRNFAGRMIDRAGGTGGANRWVVIAARLTGTAGSLAAPIPAKGDEGDGCDATAESPAREPISPELFADQMLPD